MNRLPVEKIEQVLSALGEGNSIEATSRMAKVSPNTVRAVMQKGAKVCRTIHDEKVRNLDVQSVECDELETHVYAKRANVQYAKAPPAGAGPVYLWAAACAESRLIVAYHLGDRDRKNAEIFLDDLASRVNGPLQVVTDRFKAYKGAMATVFKDTVRYVQVGKAPLPDGKGGHHLTDVTKVVVFGNPDTNRETTGHIERANLDFRMWCGPLRRKTSAFAKSREMLEAMVDIVVYHYNWCHHHRLLKTTPAAAAGLEPELRPAEQWRRVAALVYDSHPAPGRRGPYRKAKATDQDGPTPEAAAGPGSRMGGGKYFRHIVCPGCGCRYLVKKGRRPGGMQEYRCNGCGYRFAPDAQTVASETVDAARLKIAGKDTVSQSQLQTMERAFATRLSQGEARLAELETRLRCCRATCPGPASQHTV